MPTIAEQIETLRECAPRLTGRDLGFANSLLAWYDRRGLSARQQPYVQQLIDRALNPTPIATVEVGSLQPVLELLERAKRHLKHPAILMLANDMTLRLSVAGPRARVPGSINVAGTGGFADREWYGRVTTDGKFEPCRRYDQPTQQGVAEALRALAVDPAGAAARYGHLTGVCCFCGKALTDERSTTVGYGSTCADHYGLPWGVRAAAAARADREASPNPNATNRERLAAAAREPAVRPVARRLSRPTAQFEQPEQEEAAGWW